MKIDKDYKIKVTPEQSERIQKICFDQGRDWAFGNGQVRYTQQPYLYIGNIRLKRDDDNEYFDKDNNVEITAEEFIAKFGNDNDDTEGDDDPSPIIMISSLEDLKREFAKVFGHEPAPRETTEDKLSIRQLGRIIEWLYVNDGVFDSKIEWRKAFIKFLKSL